MTPSPSDEQITGHYASKFKSGNYELLRRYAAEYERVYRGFLDFINSAMGERGAIAGKRVLEIGCFTGDFLALAANAGADVVGYELQSDAVKIANERLPGRVHQSDVHNTDIPKSTADIVCLFGVVEHVLDPVRLIRRGAELLKPNGWLFVQTPDSTSIPARLLGHYWPPITPVEHINILSLRALKNVLNRCGLKPRLIKPHWKSLPINYVHQMLSNFGPELKRMGDPIMSILPDIVRESRLPFYAGEVLIAAQKQSPR